MNKKHYLFLLFLVLTVNGTGLFVDIFMQDSSLYAFISKQFSISGDYLNIYVNGKDWLDKPHFPFWVCAASISLFGVNTFAYKLPSFVFFVVGLIFTYKLSKKIYNTEVATLSTLILGSSVHIVLSNNDVRAEAILLGLIMGGIYYLYKLKSDFSLKNILFGAIFSAAAVMTKGVFVLVILYSAIFLEMLVKKNIKTLLSIRWLIVVLLTLLFIFPELYALYHQFDLHPEKTVFGNMGVSGIKFFLWDSQFGRFFNTGPIQGEGEISFFIHTMLWAFAPWTIIGFSSLVFTGKKVFEKKNTHDFTCFFGFVIMFLLFSLSRFQLPHYTNILFPFISIMSADLIVNNKTNWMEKVLKYSINAYTLLFLLVITLIEYFFRTDRLIIGIFIFLTVLFLITYFNVGKIICMHRLIILGVLSSLLFMLYLNLSFFPKLLKYQAGSQIAFYMNTHYPNDPVLVNLENWNQQTDWIMQYYAKNTICYVPNIVALKAETKNKRKFLIADEHFYTQLKNSNLDIRVLKIFEDFGVTNLRKDFFYYKTRGNVISNRYLVEVKPLYQD